MRISDQTLNRLSVLKAIRRSGPVSRTDLPKATGLSAGLITKLTSELLDRGLILEARATAKRAGRPRLYLEVAAEGAVVMGASITGQNKLTTAFVDLGGKPLFTTEVPYSPPASIEELAERAAGALAEALYRFPGDRAQVRHVGIAVPGIVNSARGDVHFVTTLPPGPVPMARIIEERLGLPVTIEHELASMARAEHWFGRAQELDTFTMVHVGHAIGSAEYALGVPKAGANGLNPELAHVKTDYAPDARRCICGTRGCVMMYSSMFGMLQSAGLLDDVPFPPLDRLDALFDRLVDRADLGEPIANAVIGDAALHLGRALSNLLNTTNPAHLLVSVLSPRFMEIYRSQVEEALRTFTPRPVLEATEIDFIVADPNWRWTGTAALALEQTYLG